MSRLTFALGLLGMQACTPPLRANELSAPVAAATHPANAQPGGDGSAITWRDDTRSPNPAPVPREMLDRGSRCGAWDERLSQVAAWLAKRGSVGGYGNDIDQLTFALRAAGTPYVWPAAWSRVSDGSDSADDSTLGLTRWLSTLEGGPLRRCGMAEADVGGKTVFVAVTSTALADLTLPLPTRARVGQWLEFQATLRVEATQAKVIPLPPAGEPMAVPTQQSRNLVRARFAAASPGQWLLQLLASGESGPRPMLEAMLFVDVAPISTFLDQPVPGESASTTVTSPAVALDRMVTALRSETGRPRLRRDPALDELAIDHARAMGLARRIGHDVGDGTTHQRLAAAGFHARLAGENVAHAADAGRAHRALWASPSHRSNLLHRGFSRWGLGVVADEDGSLWVCELFASDR